jgi:integration host factor subunit beta
MTNKQDIRTVTKRELVEVVAVNQGLSRVKAQAIVQNVLDSIVGVLSEGHRLELRDFGVFEVKTLAPRTAQNPRTLERVPVPERRSVRFKAGKGMRAKIDNPKPSSNPLPEPKVGPRDPSAGFAEDTADGRETGLNHNGKLGQ